MTSIETPGGLGFQMSCQQRRILHARKDWQHLVSQSVLLIEGDSSPALVKAAITRIVSGHDMLKTAFEQVRGIREPIQTVSSEGQFQWEEVHAHPDGVLAELLCARAAEGFDLYVMSGLHALYAFLPDSSAMLILTVPAVCSDQASLNLLVRELIEGCSEDSRNLDKAATIPLQYLQFSEWHHSLLNDEDAESGREYWQKQLAGMEDRKLVFPFERSRISAIGQGVNVSRSTMASRAATILNLAETCQVNIESLLFTAWNVLLWRLSGNQRLTSWFTTSGRDNETLGSIFGQVAAPIPIHIALDAGATLMRAAGEVQQLVAESTDWAFMYRPEVFEEQRLKNIRIGFEFTECAQSEASDAVRLTQVCSYCCTEDVDLKLSLCLVGDSVQLCFYFNPDRFSLSEVHELARCFDALVERLGPSPQLEDLSFWHSSGDEGAKQPIARSMRSEQDDKTIVQLFESQVVRTPSHLAVLCGNEAVTFAELNTRANLVANHLIASGVSTEDRIAICLERSSALLVAVIGILKASGAYVPLDPNYPAQRLHTILEEAECRFVLTQRSFRDRFSASSCRIVCLDVPTEIQATNDQNPSVYASHGSLAYVIFTSGSTGKPKGVMVNHSSVIGLLEALEDALDLGDLRTFHVGMNASLVFDASVKQWIHLLSGRTVCIPSEEERLDPRQLAGFIRNKRVGLLDATPSHFRTILNRGPDDLSQKPLAVLLGGEDIDDKLWDTLQDLSSVSFYNLYGPTECTVDVSTQRISDNVPRSIGTPLAGRQMFILDRRLRPLPELFPGELYVGGKCLARGYIREPKLTAERFIPNPFSASGGDRLYRTGDVACRLTGGAYRFLGRVDDQVKLRGYRVELGEIANTIREVPGVRDVSVLVRGDEQQLVAYVVREAGSLLSIEALRRQVQEKLPPYMVPSGFAILDKLPLTANGKVDKDALPEIGRTAASAQELPRSEMEAGLAEIWRDVLRNKQFGVHDNFFEIGGNSLLMVQIHRGIREKYGREVSMVDLFRHPTIALLSECLTDGVTNASVQRGQERGSRRAAVTSGFKR
jgi:amino acid adenylation domain-containing protein